MIITKLLTFYFIGWHFFFLFKRVITVGNKLGTFYLLFYSLTYSKIKLLLVRQVFFVQKTITLLQQLIVMCFTSILLKSIDVTKSFQTIVTCVFSNMIIQFHFLEYSHVLSPTFI